MILRRITEHVKAQNWTAVALDFLIVVVGVFIGLQVANWNDARGDRARRVQVTQTLLTDLQDSRAVQHNIFIAPINDGLEEWRAAYERGAKPPPPYLRISGSGIAPDTWTMLQQEQLTELFDPVTLFDLGYYYSELQGWGHKYIRYLTFFENEILPNLSEDPSVFYTDDGQRLKPEYAASMDRLAEIAGDGEVLRQWAGCLIYRIETKQAFNTLCRRNGYSLDGMPETKD